jgi:predicted SprT family Zn-dependent metalloprotease
MRKEPTVICPVCQDQQPLTKSLTAQSNQNVIFTCARCHETIRNIETSKGE